MCNPPNQVYVGGWVRTPTGAGSGVLSVTSPASLVSGTSTIPISQISWTSTANGNTSPDIPAGTFNGGTQALRTIAANTWVENCHTFSYANTAVVASGTYTAQVSVHAGGAVSPWANSVPAAFDRRAVALLAAGSCPAATYFVDDGSSIPFESQVVTRWRTGISGGHQMSNDIEGGATVTYGSI